MDDFVDDWGQASTWGKVSEYAPDYDPLQLSDGPPWVGNRGISTVSKYWGDRVWDWNGGVGGVWGHRRGWRLPFWQGARCLQAPHNHVPLHDSVLQGRTKATLVSLNRSGCGEARHSPGLAQG